MDAFFWLAFGFMIGAGAVYWATLSALNSERRKSAYFMDMAEKFYKSACKAERKCRRMLEEKRMGEDWKW